MADEYGVNEVNIRVRHKGEAVHGLFVSSLGRAFETLNMQKNSAGVHLAGCVVVLQLWTIQHVDVGDGSPTCSFPHVLNWPCVNDRSRKICAAFASNQIIWDWDLSEEEEVLDVVVEARNFGRESSPKLFENDESSFTCIDLYRILCEQQKFQQKCKEKAEENDNRITAIEDKIRLLQDQVFKDDHNVESSSYRTPTPRNTGKTHDGVDCQLIYRTLTSGSDGEKNRVANIKV